MGYSNTAWFPKVGRTTEETLANTIDSVNKHGHVLVRLVDASQALEKADPVRELSHIEARFSERLNSLDKDITRLKTAVYVAAVIIAGGSGVPKAVEVIKGDKPAIIQLAPEAVEALKPRP